MAVAGFANFLGYSAAGGFVGASTSAGASSILGAATRSVTYAANMAAGGMVPDPKDVILAWHKGFLPWASTKTVLNAFGIYGGEGSTRFHKHVWDEVIDSAETPLPADFARYLWKRGHITEAVFNRELKLHGFGVQWKREQLARAGAPLPLGMALESYRRGIFPSTDLDDLIELLGYRAANERRAITNLAFQLPTPTDLIRFGVREVWDEDVVEQFGYDEELPDPFVSWMKVQGLDYNMDAVWPNVPRAHRMDWPKAYWRAHWQVMSPTQAYEAFHRLRPNRIENFKQLVPDARPFSLDDLHRILKVADYPVPVRNWLAAISLRPFTRVDVRRMHRVGVLDDAEVLEAYRDLGYTPGDAAKLRDFTTATNDRNKARLEKARARTQVRNAYAVGLLSKSAAAIALFPLGEETPDELRRFRKSNSREKLFAARKRVWIRDALNAVDLLVENNRAKAIIKAIRKTYLDGSINRADAERHLANAGIAPPRITTYLDTWTAELAAKGRPATAANVRKFFLEGFIDLDEALKRLENVGYSKEDAGYVMRLVRNDLRSQIAKEEERLARTARQRRNAQLAQLRAANANRRRIIADLNRSATRPQIIRFLRHGFLDDDEAIAALVERGIEREDAVRYVAAALLEESQRGRRNGQQATSNT